MSAPTLVLSKSTSPLEVADQNLLTQLEAKVESGMMEFALALSQIKSHKGGLLWRSQGYESFEDYCQSRFDFKKQHAYRLAAAGEFVSSLDTGMPLPIRESQVRPIINKVQDPAKRVEFWTELTAKENPKNLTATVIEAEVSEYCRKNGDAAKPSNRQIKASDSTTEEKLEKVREKCLVLIGRLEEAASDLPKGDEIRTLLKDVMLLVNRKR